MRDLCLEMPRCTPSVAWMAVGREDPSRRELEAFVNAAFARKHGAQVRSFMPTLLASRDRAGALGVVGLRAAQEHPCISSITSTRPSSACWRNASARRCPAHASWKSVTSPVATAWVRRGWPLRCRATFSRAITNGSYLQAHGPCEGSWIASAHPCTSSRPRPPSASRVQVIAGAATTTPTRACTQASCPIRVGFPAFLGGT